MAKNRINKKNKLKLLILLIIILIMIAFFTNMIIYKRNANNPVKIINNVFSSLKNGNIEQINKYMDYQELISFIDRDITFKNSNEMSDLEKELFKLLEWNINNIQENEDSLIVDIEITNKNFKIIIINWINDIINHEGIDELESLRKCVSDENTDIKTVSKKIVLQKEDGKWKIKVNSDLANALFPGLENINEALVKINAD